MCPYERWVDSEYRILISGNVNYRRLPVYRNTGQLLNIDSTQLNTCETTGIANNICGLNLHGHRVHRSNRCIELHRLVELSETGLSYN